MLPVAFACPLWWVARWASRLLASLAVAGALTLGAVAPAAAASEPPRPSGLPASSESVRVSVADGAVTVALRGPGVDAPVPTTLHGLPVAAVGAASAPDVEGAPPVVPGATAGVGTDHWSYLAARPVDSVAPGPVAPAGAAAAADARMPRSAATPARASRAPPGA
ncbi:hypothetical protein [Micromonospora globbae]|uniref:hypothetical protein n=1 Tax=Micromonospora globbae TaxID=1894969 RepID=UPI003447B0AE